MQHINSKKAEIIIKLIAQTLKEKRLEQNKSQRILADEYDIPRSLLSRIESGKNEPMIISLWSICEALDIKISDLFKNIEEQLPEKFSLMEK